MSKVLTGVDKWVDGIEFHGKALAGFKAWLEKQSVPPGAGVEAAHAFEAVDEAIKALRRARSHALLAAAGANVAEHERRAGLVS